MTTTATRTYRIRFPRRGLVHIEGFDAATTGGGNDMGSHISYAAESHCAALTRGAYSMGQETVPVVLRHEDDATIAPGKIRRVSRVVEYTTAADALAGAEAYGRTHGGDVCSNCRAAAERTMATEVDPARVALLAERDQLIARLAEIDAQLAG